MSTLSTKSLDETFWGLKWAVVPVVQDVLMFRLTDLHFLVWLSLRQKCRSRVVKYTEYSAGIQCIVGNWRQWLNRERKSASVGKRVFKVCETIRVKTQSGSKLPCGSFYSPTTKSSTNRSTLAHRRQLQPTVDRMGCCADLYSLHRSLLDALIIKTPHILSGPLVCV